LAKTGRKKGRVSVKQMKFRNDPMIRLYERTQDWLQERGRPLVIAIGIIAGIVVLYVAGHYYFKYRESRAAAAYSQALEKYKAVAPASPEPAGTTTITAPGDDQTKWQEAASAFEQLANDYSGYYGTIGRYYAGVCYLRLDPNRGLSLLEEAANKNDQPTSDLARLAMAEHYAAQAEALEAEKAIPIYNQLLNSTVALKPAVQYALGKAYEKVGNTQSAIEAYFEAAKAESPFSTRQQAGERLRALAPERLKELPPITDTAITP
jgi:tetratricopeptide (TPR) repeat protein